MSWLCPNCNTKNPDNANVCQECGTSAPAKDADAPQRSFDNHSVKSENPSLISGRNDKGMAGFFNRLKCALSKVGFSKGIVCRHCGGGMSQGYNFCPHCGTPARLADSDALLTFSANGVIFNMVKVEFGTFTMGATPEQESGHRDNEEPAHSVSLDTYYIGETMVTQALWTTVMGSNPSRNKGDNLPVEMVNWYEAKEFIEKLNQLTRERFCLPTEAEWEYAARGGNKSKGYKYSGSDDIDEVAWYGAFGDGNSDGQTHEVKTKAPNELGLYDMSGNVAEWCHDWYGGYSSGAQVNPRGPSDGQGRVVRGGSKSSSEWDCRVSCRLRGEPYRRGEFLGFRLVIR